MANIDIKKKYRQRNGTPVKILVVDRPSGQLLPHQYPVIAMNLIDGSLVHYNKDGLTHCDPGLCLVEVTPFDHINEGDLVEVVVAGGKMIRVFCGVNSRGRAKVRSWSGKIQHTTEDSVRLLVRKEHIIEEE